MSSHISSMGIDRCVFEADDTDYNECILCVYHVMMIQCLNIVGGGLSKLTEYTRIKSGCMDVNFLFRQANHCFLSSSAIVVLPITLFQLQHNKLNCFCKRSR